jgi:hypothetical protein
MTVISELSGYYSANPLNINRATVSDIYSLPYIDEVTAERISAMDRGKRRDKRSFNSGKRRDPRRGICGPSQKYGHFRSKSENIRKRGVFMSGSKESWKDPELTTKKNISAIPASSRTSSGIFFGRALSFNAHN